MSLPAPDPAATVLVTGASSGIGFEFARQLAAKGHNLTVVARRRKLLDELAAEITSAHRVEVAIHERDLGSPEERRALADEVGAGDRALAGLINNAGFGSSGPFAELDKEREAEEVRVNVVALHELTGAFIGGMVKRGQGAILNVASIAAFQPIPGMATYAATKAFVQSFSESIHSELSGTGVSCTVLCPGPMATEWEQVSGVGKSWMPGATYVDPEVVVRQGIEAMERGRRTCVPGRVPQVLAAGGRFAPRTFLLPATRAFRSRGSRGSG